MIFLPFGDRRNNGVDMALTDYFFNGQGLGVVKCKVIKRPYKKQAITYIGLSEVLQPKEIIQVGNLGIKYQIIGQTREMLPTGGFVFRIKRVDGANITNTDLQNILLGQTARIVNRRSNRQRAKQLYDFLKEKDEE